MSKPRFMPLPITWIISKDDSEEDKERNELLGIKPETSKEVGVMYVNPEHIVAYNISRNKNQCTVRLADGDIYTILLSIKELEIRIDEFYNPSVSIGNQEWISQNITDDHEKKINQGKLVK